MVLRCIFGFERIQVHELRELRETPRPWLQPWIADQTNRSGETHGQKYAHELMILIILSRQLLLLL
jgi:hypothetical protein